jgi:hypothetical protein
MPLAGFEPTIPASERTQTHALDRAATGIGDLSFKDNIFYAASHVYHEYWINSPASISQHNFYLYEAEQKRKFPGVSNCLFMELQIDMCVLENVQI